jgi:Skp family chaperone for outer membrane proteins
MSALIKGILGERISVKVGTDKKKMTRKEIMARQIVNEAGKGNFRALKTLLSLTMDRMVEEQEEAHKRARQQEQAALEWEELRKRLNRKVAEKEREAEQRFQAAVDEEVKRRLGMQSDGGDEPHGAAQSIIQEKRSWDPDY